jgi:cell wall assembly regulator SMI1
MGSEPDGVVDLWTRWEGWLARYAPDLRSGLRPPAPREAVAAVEERLGVVLPRDFRDSLAVHDGAEEVSGLVGGWDLMRLDHVVQEAETMRRLSSQGAFGDASGEPHRAISTGWWHPNWVPVVSSGSGHFFCIDLAPTAAGTVGQIILVLHDDGRRFLVANSYSRWLAAVVSDLEEGAYRLEDDEWNHLAFMRSSREGRDLYPGTSS